jgi:hypothetical protein
MHEDSAVIMIRPLNCLANSSLPVTSAPPLTSIKAVD